MRLGTLAAVALLALIGAACNESSSPPSLDDVTTSVDPPLWDPQRDPADLVLEMTLDGGFAMTDELLTRQSVFAIYADGTALVPERTEGTNPMLRRFERVVISSSDIDRITALTSDMDLRNVDREVDDSARGSVFDAATTIVTYHDETGATHSYGVYALGYNVTTRTARAGDLAELKAMFERAGAAADGTPYQPVRVQLWHTARAGQSTDRVAWPLGVSPEEFSTAPNPDFNCLVLAGDLADDAVEALSGLDRHVVFEFDNTRYWVLAKTLIPGDEGCGPEIGQVATG